MRNISNRAMQTYVQVNYDSAAEYGSSSDLLNLLLSGLTDSLIDAQRFLNEKKYSEKGVAVSKAQRILIALRETLDFEVGGDLAVNLDELYAYSLRRIAEGHARNDGAKIREVHGILSALRDAWLQASRSTAA
jgi:flagellar protein FliS